MVDSDDTYDDYSIEFDDDNDVSNTKSASPVVNDSKIEGNLNGTTRRKNKGYKTGKSCRICLKRCKKQSKDASEFAEIYLKCTGFSFEEGQGPTKVCYPCMNELLKVENFIEKCSETEDKLSKGLVPKDDSSSEGENDISDISDVDVVIEGESDGSNFSDTIVKKKKKRGRPRVEKKPKPLPMLPKKENRGRRPLSPSKRKPILPKGPRGRPRGSFKVKDVIKVPKGPPGRPKNSFKVKSNPPLKSVKNEDGTQHEATEEERQICFMCGKLVRKKHLPYHVWKHRKDEQTKSIDPDAPQPSCEFCNKTYRTEDLLKNHMQRIHPAVAWGMPKDVTPEPETIDDNFEKEFHVPSKDEYPQIQSPYNHNQALYYLQKNVKR